MQHTQQADGADSYLARALSNVVVVFVKICALVRL
jgi:hypothetical protein